LGSIRGDFGFDSPQLAVRSGRIVFETIVHVSDSKEEAGREITYWLGDNFKEMKYKKDGSRGLWSYFLDIVYVQFCKGENFIDR
jgi:hypothetical protein